MGKKTKKGQVWGKGRKKERAGKEKGWRREERGKVVRASKKREMRGGVWRKERCEERAGMGGED